MQLRNTRRASCIGSALIVSALMASTALGQSLIEGPPPKIQKHHDIVATTLDFPTGEYQGINIATGRTINVTDQKQVVWEDVLRVNGVAWLRLYFSADTHLEADSFIRVTSLHDGEVQNLDATTLSMWNNTTAYFNGNALKIELVADSHTVHNQFTIEEYAFEVGVADRGDGCGICGNDDRAPSTDNNFCRLMPVGCSATTINEDSCMVTAGHCLGQSGSVVQFNVPASNSDCSTNNPPVADQFPVTAESGVNGGVGNDYGALAIGTNSSGERPYDRYGTFIPLASSVPGSGTTLSNHGYGVDSQCQRSQTQQTHSGPISGGDSSAIYYDIDVTYGNSGSSLVYGGEVVGVVTHCSFGCENYGTRIDYSGFQSTIDFICNGGDPGDCPAGEIEDCNGNCCPANWVGDGYCDDGSYSHNGVPIYLNCEEFNCDGGDCECDDPGDPTGACCYGTDCADNVTQADCANGGGDYQGDSSSCDSDPCGGGGGGEGDSCAEARDAYTGANAFDTSDNTDSGFGDPDESQCEGTYLDWENSPDEWFRWVASATGTAAFSTCDAASYDTSLVLYSGSSCSSLTQIACNGDADGGGDCQTYYSEISGVSVTSGSVYYIRIGGWQADTGPGTLTISVEGGGDPTGACCYGTDCAENVTQADCANGGGDYQGDGSSCAGDPCGGSDPMGGCCVGTSCSVETAASCASMGGDYLGDGSSCAGNPCGGGGGGSSSLELAGIESWDSYESPNNEIHTITIPAGSNILALEWTDVTLSAYDPSWASEAGLMFTWENDGVPFSGYLTIFEEQAPGDYGPVSGSIDLTEDYNFSDADGEIQVEFFETYDDAADSIDATWTGGMISVIHDGDGGGDPTGACCVDEVCTPGQTQAYCTAAGGEYLGDGSDCEGDPCASNAVGACCVDLVCTPGQSEAYCTAAGGEYLGDGSDCEGDPCNPNEVTGACCTNGGHSCHETTAYACSEAGGAYLGDYTTCEGSDPCGVGSEDFGIAHAVVGDDLHADGGTFTADIYVTMPMGWRLDAVAGTPEQQKMLTCSGDFIQNGYGGPTSTDVNPQFYEFDPDLEWDSRVTIGCIDSSGNPFDENNLQNIGIDWAEFENGGDLSVGNGLWFHLPTDVAGTPTMFTASDCSQQYGVLIARLSMTDGSEVGFSGLVQGSDGNGDAMQAVVETYFDSGNFVDCNGNMVADACDIANGTSDDADGNGVPDECDSDCPGDSDGDGDADVDDILNVIANFGQGAGGDVDGDGDTDVDDILQVISHFGNC